MQPGLLELLYSGRVAMDPAEPGYVYIDQSSDVSLLGLVRYELGQRQQVVRLTSGELDVRLRQRRSETSAEMAPEATSLVDSPNDSPVVQLVDNLIHTAIVHGASDIHFEPGEASLACRYRLDGMLVHLQTIDKAQVPAALSRIKIMSGLDIAERRRPQDGRIRFACEGRLVDIRVSVIPTEFGEKAVLRLLDKKQLRLDLASLGFSEGQLRLFGDRIHAPNGLILVTGPTGSGKTTTLYAALNALKRPEVNISTVEDPIEYNLAGINQTQVKPDIGLTFAAMLRALLRQDPNIIMVGEIRDRDTLDIALRASLTGHLVLSTVHTNSAVATVTRLLDMGAEPFLLSSTLRLIVAQRLVRLNCPHCVEPLSEQEQAAAQQLGYACQGSEQQGAGCECCKGTGFLGRKAIYELLSINDTLRLHIQASGAEVSLEEIAHREGFVSMRQAGFELIKQGATVPSEVLREIVG